MYISMILDDSKQFTFFHWHLMSDSQLHSITELHSTNLLTNDMSGFVALDRLTQYDKLLADEWLLLHSIAEHNITNYWQMSGSCCTRSLNTFNTVSQITGRWVALVALDRWTQYHKLLADEWLLLHSIAKHSITNYWQMSGSCCTRSLNTISQFTGRWVALVALDLTQNSWCHIKTVLRTPKSQLLVTLKLNLNQITGRVHKIKTYKVEA